MMDTTPMEWVAAVCFMIGFTVIAIEAIRSLLDSQD